MAINPLQNIYIPPEHTVEHHEQKTEKPQENLPVQNPVQAEVVQQQGEPIPIQHSQESAEAKYTDRDREEGRKQDQDEDDLDGIQKKTQKSMKDLEEGLERVADGIELLKELQQEGLPDGLDQRLQHISSTGSRLVVDIEKTVEMAVSSTLAAAHTFFGVSVDQLTSVRLTVDTYLIELASVYPAESILKTRKIELEECQKRLIQSTNQLLEAAEEAIHKLLAGRELISSGYETVKQADADGFKAIESGFKMLFASVYEIADRTSTYRREAESLIKHIAELPIEPTLTNRAKPDIPEIFSTISDKTEECWREVQGYLARLMTASNLFGNSLEETFETASKAVLGEGQVAVGCVNEDLGDLKDEVKQSLTPSVAHAIDQILDGAEQVEEALDELVTTSKQKHDRIKRGSTAKLPSHFNVRL